MELTSSKGKLEQLLEVNIYSTLLHYFWFLNFHQKDAARSFLVLLHILVAKYLLNGQMTDRIQASLKKYCEGVGRQKNRDSTFSPLCKNFLSTVLMLAAATNFKHLKNL